MRKFSFTKVTVIWICSSNPLIGSYSIGSVGYELMSPSHPHL